MAKSKTADILSSLHPYARMSKKIENLKSQNPLIISGTNQLQHKAMMKLLEEMQNLVEATTSNTGMDVIPESMYISLPIQISQTPNNGITKDSNTNNVVVKDNAGDYIVISGTPWATRYSQLVNFTANVPEVITHSLWTPDVVVMVRDSLTNQVVYPEIRIIDAISIEVISTEGGNYIITCV